MTRELFILLMILAYFMAYLSVVVQLSVEAKYPANWNDHQTWKCVLTACKASGYLVFQHKEFFQGYFLSCVIKRNVDCECINVCYIINDCCLHSGSTRMFI